MLTNRQLRNLQNFDSLSKNYKRVLRYRLRKASVKTIKDMKLLLLKHQDLNMKIDDLVDVQELKDLVRTYTKLKERCYYASL
jgi:TRAP-type mannitol/chloroaromatic compound transport system substrate-binding protein